MKRIYILVTIILAVLLSSTSLYILYIDNGGNERAADVVYVGDGTEFLEVDVEKFEVNRTLDLGGTSVSINHYNGSLYGAVGAINEVQIIDEETFQRKSVYKGHTDNVQEIHYNSNRDEIYSVSTDTNVHKIDSETLETIEVFDEHNSPVMNSALSNNGNYLYTSGFDTFIHKIETESFESVSEIRGFPEGLNKVMKVNETLYYIGNRGGLYMIDENRFEDYEHFDELDEDNYTNLYYNRTTDNVESSKLNGPDVGVISIAYNQYKNVLYAGTADGKIYELNPETLEEKRVYNVTEEREIEYNYSKADSPSIIDGQHIYEDDVRGLGTGPKGKYIYATTAPGSLIEISADSFEKQRVLRLDIGKRTVGLDVE